MDQCLPLHHLGGQLLARFSRFRSRFVSRFSRHSLTLGCVGRTFCNSNYGDRIPALFIYANTARFHFVFGSAADVVSAREGLYPIQQ